MNTFFEKTVGIGHFLFDRKPSHVPTVTPRHRTTNAFSKNGRALVATVRVDGSPKDGMDKALSLLGGLPRAIRRGDRVMVKPNFNSSDEYPASTDLEFLRAVIELLLDAGATVTIGESAGGMWRPTSNVFRKAGLYALAGKLGVSVSAFDDRGNDWLRVKIDGDYLKGLTMPRSAYEADKLVYVPCMKTHFLASYSGALKLAFGFVHPGERRSFHFGNLQHKLAEVNLCWQPHLILMDGRKAFVSGGPDRGTLAHPGLILASGDLIATDVEAIKVLIEHGAGMRLPADPWQLPQIMTAVKHGLGAGPGDFDVVG